MEVEEACGLGLCFGVRRATEMLKREVPVYGGIETLGPLAHNQQLMQRLIEVGVTPVDCLEHIKGKTVAIPTHGASPEILSQLKARHIHIIDTTCPIVQQAQNAAEELSTAGFEVIVFGDAGHSEVKGLLGWTRGRGMVVSDIEQVAALIKLSGKDRDFRQLGVISQTTQTWPVFCNFIRQLMEKFTTWASDNREQVFKELRVINTLCTATQERQRAAMELAQRSQLMIVVGGYDSANTIRLTEICSPLVKTYQVERADEIDKRWVTGKQHIGITAGASTPDEITRDVVNRLKSFLG
jgi:4-hydroxy-3-methylbut-2-enyl diphosphate reductase